MSALAASPQRFTPAPRTHVLATAVVGSVVLHALLAGLVARYVPTRQPSSQAGLIPTTLVLPAWPADRQAERPDADVIPPPPPPPRKAEPLPAVVAEAEPSPPEPKPIKEPEVALGVDDGAEPTENMLGAAHAEENLAPKASVDQPALALEPGAPGTALQAPPAMRGEATSPTQAVPAMAEQTPEAGKPEPEPPASEAAPRPTEQPERVVVTPQPQEPLPASALVDALAAMVAAREAQDATARQEPPTLREPQRSLESQDAPPRPRQDAQEARAEVRPAPASPPAPAGGDSRLPGARADSESEAFSTTGALEFRPGMPLAGKGIRVRTVLPRFSITTRLMAVPSNPVIVVKFSRTGKVLHASFENNKGTGYEEVDTPLLAAVHRWTATGEQLLRIPAGDPKAGVTFKIKYILRE